MAWGEASIVCLRSSTDAVAVSPSLLSNIAIVSANVHQIDGYFGYMLGLLSELNKVVTRLQNRPKSSIRKVQEQTYSSW